jgi:hypothetical protein
LLVVSDRPRPFVKIGKTETTHAAIFENFILGERSVGVSTIEFEPENERIAAQLKLDNEERRHI